MKGIIFNIFESFVDKNISSKIYEESLEEAKDVNDFHLSSETYSDKEFFTLFEKVLSKIKLNKKDALFSFGEFLIKELLKNPLVKDYKNPEDILLNLDNVIHVEVKKIFLKAEPPRFNVKYKEDNKTLSMEYISKRKLCYLVDGILSGLGKHFNKKAIYSHDVCMLKNDSSCIYEVSFE